MNLPHVIKRDPSGMHYAGRIFVGTTILWILLQKLGDINPLWAIISLIVVTEPQLKHAWIAFKGRIINTVAGCATGLVFLLLFHQNTWVLPFSLTVMALISTYVIRLPVGWRIGPVTTAIVVSAGLTESSNDAIINIAMHRTMEVLTGSAMALIVTWGAARLWGVPETEPPAGAQPAAKQ